MAQFCSVGAMHDNIPEKGATEVAVFFRSTLGVTFEYTVYPMPLHVKGSLRVKVMLTLARRLAQKQLGLKVPPPVLRVVASDSEVAEAEGLDDLQLIDALGRLDPDVTMIASCRPVAEETVETK